MRSVVIVGSGIAGFTAGIYSARANMKPLIITGMPLPEGGGVLGGQLTITTEVENFPGFPEGVQGPELMEKVQKQAERFGAEVIQDHVTSVDFGRRPFKIQTQNGQAIEAETVIVCTGASAKYIGLPNEKRLGGHGVSACATCDGFFFRNKDIFVVGGGDTAMEEATFLTKFARSVTLLHRRHGFKASKIMLERARRNPKISFKVPYEVLDVLGQDKVTGLKLRNTETGGIEEAPADGLFLAIGHQPNTAAFKDQLDMDETGYLLVDSRMRVLRDGKHVDGVYAAGDVADHRYRQAITAAGTGCAAALEAIRFLEEHSLKTVEA